MKENLEKFKALFPMEVEVTQDIIDGSELMAVHGCTGALTLNKGLGKEGIALLRDGIISWGRISGGQIILDNDVQVVEISSHSEAGKSVDMMDVRKPCKVTFKIASIYLK